MDSYVNIWGGHFAAYYKIGHTTCTKNSHSFKIFPCQIAHYHYPKKSLIHREVTILDINANFRKNIASLLNS